MFISATQLRIGMIILHNNDLYKVTSVYHHTPGNLRAQVHVKMKRVKDGVSFENRFRSEDSVEKVNLEQKEMQYLYEQDKQYYFMDTKSYEQLFLTDEILGDSIHYLLPNTLVKIEFYENEAMGVELPQTVELKVISTDASMKGSTASASYKPAEVETGFIVQVPPFIKNGDIIKIDTTTGKYLERANK